MTVRPQPEQQAPPVQKLRVEYAKRGRARFASHRDFARALERALRRAEVPMAYSSGYSPHPRISYGNAAPTGAASEAEYVEIGLSEVVDLGWLARVVGEALPEGMDVIRVVPAVGASLMDRLQASSWLIDVDATREVLDRAVTALLDAESVLVERRGKSGSRGFDARPAIVSLVVRDDRTLEFVGRHGSPLVRPDDVVAAMQSVCPDLVLTRPALMTRVSQGPLVGSTVIDPLAEPGDAPHLDVGSS
jgi:radical SAM-linked protein